VTRTPVPSIPLTPEQREWLELWEEQAYFRGLDEGKKTLRVDFLLFFVTVMLCILPLDLAIQGALGDMGKAEVEHKCLERVMCFCKD